MPEGSTDDTANNSAGEWRRLPIKSFWAYVLFIGPALCGIVGTLFSPIISDWIKAAFWPQISTALLAAYPLWVCILTVASLFVALLGVAIYVVNRIDAARIGEGTIKVEAERRIIAGQRAECDKLRKLLDSKERDNENLKMLYRDSERLRLTDPITGVPNFQSWEKDLRNWAQQGQNERERSLLLIDFDKIKWINERNPDGSCADEILRYFAQTTYNSMRRDEHVYKSPEESSEMYRHYQGGDEFFFILSGDVFDTIGFANRLAGRIRAYQEEIHKTILVKYLNEEDRATFKLTFSCAVIAIHPGDEPAQALTNAYSVLHRAKTSPRSRLLAVFGAHYDHPEHCRTELEGQLARIQRQLDAGSRTEKEAEDHEATARRLAVQIGVLINAEQLFKPVVVAQGRQ